MLYIIFCIRKENYALDLLLKWKIVPTFVLGVAVVGSGVGYC